MKLIVGLGNPGEEYTNTRHNAGFISLMQFAAQKSESEPLQWQWKEEKKVHGMIARGKMANEDVILLMPSTFMNRSGESVSAALSFYKCTAADVIVVHDEIAFPLGTVRIAQEGSSGGHNGVQSIIESLGAEKFLRVRFGIGETQNADETLKKNPVRLEHYVLQNFSKDETAAVRETISRTVETLDKLLTNDLAKTIQETNTKKKE